MAKLLKCDERKNAFTPEDCTKDATHEVRGYFMGKLRRKVIHLCDEHAALWNELNMGGLCGKPPAVEMGRGKRPCDRCGKMFQPGELIAYHACLHCADCDRILRRLDAEP